MKRLPPLLLALLVVACVEETVEPNDLRPVDRVVLSAPRADVLLGDSLRLGAVGLASDGDTLPGRAITWGSSDTGIVSISPGGYAVGRGSGVATVTATIEGQSDTLSVGGVVLRFAAISAGGNQACGLMTDGSAWCWGSNLAGALGVGDVGLALSRYPRKVSGQLTLTSIATGHNASCGLTAGGEAWCWGSNSHGQLGNGTTLDQPAPLRVLGGVPFASITRPSLLTYSMFGSGTHTCALSTVQTAYCWGSNGAGQLGDGTRQSRLTPAMVQGGHTFGTLTAGGDVSCATVVGASTWCWGSDVSGRLGHDTSYASSTPAPVLGGTGFDQIASNSYAPQICGVGGGTLRCWGVGLMDYVVRGQPTTLAVPAQLVAVSEGARHACGLTGTGQAWCWGSNDFGQLGNGTTEWSGLTPPTAVAGGLVFTSISAGWERTCGLVAAGDAYCWGDNGSGVLGTGNAASALTAPVLVQGGHTFAQLSLMDDHICGVDLGGSAYCWGSNYSGQLGDGTTGTRSVPTLVQGGLTFESVKAGAQYTCGLVSGAAYCWGQNYYGNLGDGSTTSSAVPVPVTGGHSYFSLSPGRTSTCGVEAGGAAYCWGWNTKGQLGDGSTVNSLQPIAVAGGHQFSSVVQADGSACGLTGAGEVYCWGDNLYGQLGNGVTASSAQPVDVQGGFSFVAIESGGGSSCGLTGGGEVYCWPRSPGSGSLPTLVPGGHQFARISVGGNHACGITTGGQAYCWGSNNSGALGDGSLNTDVFYTTPRAVLGGHVFASISAGLDFTCGITTAGVAYCWGANWDGQVGAAVDDQAYQILTPAKVRGQP